MIIFYAFRMETLSVFDTIGTNKHSLMNLVNFSHREYTVLPSPVPSLGYYCKFCLFLTLGQMLQYCTMTVLFLKIIM